MAGFFSVSFVIYAKILLEHFPIPIVHKKRINQTVYPFLSFSENTHFYSPSSALSSLFFFPLRDFFGVASAEVSSAPSAEVSASVVSAASAAPALAVGVAFLRPRRVVFAFFDSLVPSINSL